MGGLKGKSRGGSERRICREDLEEGFSIWESGEGARGEIWMGDLGEDLQEGSAGRDLEGKSGGVISKKDLKGGSSGGSG